MGKIKKKISLGTFSRDELIKKNTSNVIISIQQVDDRDDNGSSLDKSKLGQFKPYLTRC